MNGKHRFGFGMFNPENIMGGFQREARAKRGDIKYFILEVLEKKPSHGYEIIRSLEERWDGRYKPSPGSVYPTLQLLEEGGYLISQQMDSKKVYTITEEGKQLLKERGHVNSPEPEFENISSHDVKMCALKLAEAVRQGIKVGNKDTIGRIIGILDKARKEIYIVLSET